MKARKKSQHKGDTTSDLHPAIYRVIIGSLVFWVIAAWAFFAGGSGYGAAIVGIIAVFAIVSFFIFNRIAAIEKNHPDGGRAEPSRISIRDWLSGEFEIWSGHLRGRDAAITLLMPIFAAVIGALAFVLIIHAIRP